MKNCKLTVQKLSTEQPILELKTTATIDEKELVAVYSRGIISGKWNVAKHPDYKSVFALNDEQTNEIRIVLGSLVDEAANGNPDGLRSMMQTSISDKRVAEISFE